MGEIQQFISAVGFPICMCFALVVYLKGLSTDHKEEVKQLTDSNQKNVTLMTEAINNNTKALQELYRVLGVE